MVEGGALQQAVFQAPVAAQVELSRCGIPNLKCEQRKKKVRGLVESYNGYTGITTEKRKKKKKEGKAGKGCLGVSTGRK